MVLKHVTSVITRLKNSHFWSKLIIVLFPLIIKLLFVPAIIHFFVELLNIDAKPVNLIYKFAKINLFVFR